MHPIQKPFDQGQAFWSSYSWTLFIKNVCPSFWSPGHFWKIISKPRGLSLFFTAISVQKRDTDRDYEMDYVLSEQPWRLFQEQISNLLLKQNKKKDSGWRNIVEHFSWIISFALKAPSGRTGDTRIWSNLTGRGQASATILPSSVCERGHFACCASLLNKT